MDAGELAEDLLVNGRVPARTALVFQRDEQGVSEMPLPCTLETVMGELLGGDDLAGLGAAASSPVQAATRNRVLRSLRESAMALGRERLEAGLG